MVNYGVVSGIVKWFDSKKGFGFVTDGKKDYFAHFKNIEMIGHKELIEGQKIQFEPSMSERGMLATKIKIIDQ